MTKPEPIYLVNLLPELDELLKDCLKNLSPADWNKVSLAAPWTVKDVVAHLLDGNLRSLSMLRDGYFGETPPKGDTYPDLVRYLNRLNADWVTAFRRISPTLLMALLEESGQQYVRYLQSLAPHESAIFSVAWAGEQESENWFHIAREYTEKWHHQQQIRMAVQADNVLLQEKYYSPYLDTSIRALPHHYRSVKANPGTLIKFIFRGVSNEIWYLAYQDTWELYTAVNAPATTEVVISAEMAWRIFTKGISRSAAIAASTISGDQQLGLKVFDMLAVMA